MHSFSFFLCLSVAIISAIGFQCELAEGAKADKWNAAHIEWKSFNAAMATSSSHHATSSQRESKPMLLLFHKSWCPACKALERHVADSMAIEVLAEHFTMVDIFDDDEPHDKQYSPQGLYYPRIMFAHSNGTILKTIKNDRHHEAGHDHYFGDADSIAEAMKRTLTLLGYKTFRGL